MKHPSSSSRDDESIQFLVNENASTEDVLHAIDQEVNEHKACLIALWKRRNTFVPISRLPPELLCKIFDFTTWNQTEGSLHWIKVTHVCHEWRSIALNSPSLWINLPLQNARWSAEMLSRSKMASLVVDANPPSYRDFPLEAVSSALRHISRIIHLSLSDANAGTMQKLLSDLPKSAPRLETLRSLRAFFAKWIVYTGLKSLDIHDIPPASRPTATQLWNALKRMPHLGAIDLHDALPVAEDCGPPQATIFLSNLQKLTVTSTAPEVQLFFKSISFLPTVIITVVCKTLSGSGPDFIGVLSAISATISPTAKSCGILIRGLEVSTPSAGLDGLRFLAYTASDIEADNGTTTPILDLSLRCETSLGRTVHDKLLIDMFSAISLGGLIDLRLKPEIKFSSRAFAESFGTLPHLQSVYTAGAGAYCFTMALQEVPLHQDLTKSQYPGLVFFPGLRFMSMYDIDFDEDDGDITIDALQDCLIWRYECGVEVWKLNIKQCSRITEDEVNLLREIIADLEWDDLEFGFTDYEDDEDDDDYDDDPEYDDYDSSEADGEYIFGSNSFW
ncbi:hypothetical protein GALMADRAFT_135857 [Galerina marginata CBS 339.88]|uniref:F-box domain-containing protein n=1 Tax=Galerina marginata (strain CBS 339.88) TaxID=685588 RepID=A0A067TBY7_GALM3|nr:hypothetical protein GALMADRAFT_135857 [Galerina marginata CBS 339.88]